MRTITLNTFFIYCLSILIFINIVNTYYGVVIMQLHFNLSPVYAVFFTGLIINLILLVLLHTKKLAPLTYLYLIITLIYGFIISGQWNTNNPFFWLHRGDVQAFIGIMTWVLELLFSMIGLIIWFIARRQLSQRID